ncbi:hypothetical protein BDFG_07652 [Blastomyces dermatitidis ATCC 26199]|nr:hypothetical protein BDFG_07652 [Blastomyces dermatitidis ATCC 26199]
MKKDNASPVSVRVCLFWAVSDMALTMSSSGGWKVAARGIRLVKINCKVPIVFMDEKIDTFAVAVIKVAAQHMLECAFPSITHLYKSTVRSPWLLDML